MDGTVSYPLNSIETSYLELRDYESELKEDIRRFKEEKAEKVAYLNSLDKQQDELIARYYLLLQESRRLSEKIAVLEKGMKQ